MSRILLWLVPAGWKWSGWRVTLRWIRIQDRGNNQGRQYPADDVRVQERIVRCWKVGISNVLKVMDIHSGNETTGASQRIQREDDHRNNEDELPKRIRQSLLSFL